MRKSGWLILAALALSPSLTQAQTTPVGDAAAGAGKYAELCASCHGPKARGGQGPDLTQHDYMHGSADENIIHSIRDGQSGGMPAFGASLTDADLYNLVAFLKERRADPTNPKQPSPQAFPPTMPKGVVKTEVENFRVQTVAKVGTPYGFAFLPDGRILITEISGSLRMVQKGRLLPDPVADAPTGGVEGQHGQRGHNLLDVFVDPDYKANGWIYLSTVKRVKNDDPGGGVIAKITRGRIRDNHWVDSQVLTEFPVESSTGLRMAFDAHRHLFIGTSWPNDQFVSPEQAPKMPPQVLSSSMGKILRMTEDGKAPADNPFIGRADAFPYVYAYGVRTPTGIAFDRKGELWETENGPRGGDELNHIHAGRNYGWPIATWGLRYDDVPNSANPTPKGVEQPIINWSPSPAVSAIAFYYGKAFPHWSGNLIMGSLKQTDLYRIVLDGDRPVLQEVILHAYDRIRDVQIGPDGYIYVLGDMGGLVRLVPAR